MTEARIIVVGDSGVGKTSLVHLLCYGEPCVNPTWTVGCSIEVKVATITCYGVVVNI